jgi:hypothetical protein
MEVLCCVRVCESASLRYCQAAKRVQSPDPCFHCNPHIVYGVRPIWNVYTGCINIQSRVYMDALWLRGAYILMGGAAGEGQNEWYCLFSLCAGREDLLPPLHNPHPFCFCLYVDVW